MAKVSRFRQNVSLIQDGDWISVGDNPSDLFRIKTRGQTPKFLIRLNQLQREAAREANRNLSPGAPAFRSDDLPPPLANRCLGQAMAEETFLDVKDLDDDGGPVTAAQFREFLLKPSEYSVFVLFAYGAMLKLHEDRTAEVEAAAGNSQPASAGT